MLRTTRLLASALFVISVSALSTGVGYGGGDPDLGAISVVGVEMRSACDALNEWWVQAKNTSTTESFMVVISATVVSYLGNTNSVCTVSPTTTLELAPGQCDRLFQNYPNNPPRPCDSKCCQDNDMLDPEWQVCNTPEQNTRPIRSCTRILNALVTVKAWKPDAHSEWQELDPQPAICGVGDSAGPAVPQMQVINTCRQPTPSNPNPYYRNWSLRPCQSL